MGVSVNGVINEISVNEDQWFSTITSGYCWVLMVSKMVEYRYEYNFIQVISMVFHSTVFEDYL